MPIAKSVEDTVLGEALAGNYQDMLGIVSVIDNRSKSLGVTYDDVVSARGQFDAYGKALPPGVGKYRDMARQAVAEVRSKGPVHTATFYATPAAVKGLPKGLAPVARTEGHQFFSDPQNRSIATAQGYKTPDPAAISTPQGLTNVAGDPADTLDDVAPAQATTYAATPEIGPTPASRPDMGLLAEVSDTRGRGLAALTSPESMRSAQQAIDAIAPASPTGLSAGRGILSGYQDMTDPVAYGRSATRGAQPFTGAVAHHAVPTTLEALRSVTNTPRAGGAFLGYHFAVDPTGKVGQLAPLDARTNHIGRVGSSIGKLSNANSLGIAFTDAYGPVTQASIDAAAETIAAVNRAGQYGFIDPDDIGYHGKGATGARSVEGKLEAEGIKSYLGGLPFGPNHTPTPTPAPRGPEPATAASVMSVERGTLGPVSAPGLASRGLTAPDFSSSRATQASNIGPGATTFGPAISSDTYSTPTIDTTSPVSRSRGVAGGMPRGFTELGAIGRTGRIGVAPAAPASIVGPIAMPTQMPRFDPVAPPAPPAPARVAVPIRAPRMAPPPVMAPPVAPPVAPRSAPTAPSMAAPPTQMATAADVWGGRAATGRTTGGSTLSRNDDGTLSFESKYGYTDTWSPTGEHRGTTAPGLFGIDQAARSMFGNPMGQVSIPGPLGPLGRARSQQQAPAPSRARSPSIGPAARGVAGAAMGSVVGGMFGPLGAMLGATLGRNLATGKTALGKFTDFGRVAMPSPTQARSAFAQGFTPGLSFPTAPTGNASQGGLTSFGEEASRGDHGGQAQAAANSPGRGLY